jgi:hydroxyethylthiazole kinase-like uncharacterized protein yjeF
MPGLPIASHPVLTPDEVRAQEGGLFGGDERSEWKAMLWAGAGVAHAVLRDYAEIGAFPADARILVLAGKGNNAGDALIAAREILELFPGAEVDVLFAFGSRKLKPLAAKAWRGIVESGRSRVRSVGAGGLASAYALAIDGIFGFQYRPPLPPEAHAAIAAADACAIRFRASVDLPSGLGEAGAFRADFTYATGSVKTPLLGCANAGRPRYVDLGFFGGGGDEQSADRVILPAVLAALAGLRPASVDKRSQGHVALVGGSGHLPGAILMSTLAALRSGVGLVTAFVPESLMAAYAACAPEAMWVGLPESSTGGLTAAGLKIVLAGSARATAFALGSGLGRERGSLVLAKGIVKASKVPVAIDGDALQADIVRVGKAPRILTPHAGELERIAKGAELLPLCRELHAAIIAKGPVTRVSEGGVVYHSFFGGPVLARGGSGDVLAGLAGGLLAQTPGDPLGAACRAAAWHGWSITYLRRSGASRGARSSGV